MKRSIAGRVVPGLLMTAATAFPVLTTAEILAHVTPAGASGTLTSAQPSAGSSGAASAASSPTPTATSAAKPKSRSASARKSSHPTAVSTAQPTKATSTPHVYAGTAVYDRFGAVQAQITVAGKKITKVSISAPMNDPRSADINSQAVPLLQSETLQAQSANINVISGATETSQAYLQSLQSALSQAGL